MLYFLLFVATLLGLSFLSEYLSLSDIFLPKPYKPYFNAIVNKVHNFRFSAKTKFCYYVKSTLKGYAQNNSTMFFQENYTNRKFVDAYMVVFLYINMKYLNAGISEKDYLKRLIEENKKDIEQIFINKSDYPEFIVDLLEQYYEN